MHYGKKLKRRHKEFLAEQGLRGRNYLITKDTAEHMEFINKRTGKILVFRY